MPARKDPLKLNDIVEGARRASVEMDRVFGRTFTTQMDKMSKSVDVLTSSFDKLTNSLKNVQRASTLKITVDDSDLIRTQAQFKKLTDGLQQGGKVKITVDDRDLTRVQSQITKMS